jgi:hypothetical protein
VSRQEASVFQEETASAWVVVPHVLQVQVREHQEGAPPQVVCSSRASDTVNARPLNAARKLGYTCAMASALRRSAQHGGIKLVHAPAALHTSIEASSEARSSAARTAVHGLRMVEAIIDMMTLAPLE